MNRGHISIALAAAAALAAPLAAQDAPTTIVRYGDLDLAAPPGQSTFSHRIASAVSVMCAQSGSRDLATLSAVARCKAAARASASPQVATLFDRAQQTASREDGAIRLASR